MVSRGRPPAGPSTVRRRSGESGQALILALLLILVLSMAAALVAAEIALVLRAMDEQTARARLRTLEDAGVAEALASLGSGRGVPAVARRIGDGEVDFASDVMPEGRLRVEIEARYRGMRSAVELVVIPSGRRPPRVLSYRSVVVGEVP